MLIFKVLGDFCKGIRDISESTEVSPVFGMWKKQESYAVLLIQDCHSWSFKLTALALRVCLMQNNVEIFDLAMNYKGVAGHHRLAEQSGYFWK